jgi:hypothetical protein
MAAPAAAQFQARFDVTQDGVLDDIAHDDCGLGWNIIDGATGAAVVNLRGIDSDEAFTLASTLTPDMTGDGVPDAIVFGPAGERYGVTIGRAYLFSGADGSIRWILEGDSTDRLFIGVATVPDQNNDDWPDLVFRSLDQTDHGLDRALLIDAKSGAVLRSSPGSMLDHADWARQGRRLYLATDLDGDEQTQVPDLGLFVQLVDADEPAADINNDGLTDALDMGAVVADLGTTTVEIQPLVPRATDPTGRRIGLDEPTATDLLLLIPPPGNRYMVYDPFTPLAPEELDADLCDGPLDAIVLLLDATVSSTSTDTTAVCRNAIQNPNYTPSPNGCGNNPVIAGICTLSPYISLFSQCCDTHDVCYGTCAGSIGTVASWDYKSGCDGLFGFCMAQRCSLITNTLSRYFCYENAAVFHWAVRVHGSYAFKSAQSRACICCDQPNPDSGCPTNDPDPDPGPDPDPDSDPNPNNDPDTCDETQMP